MRKILSFVFVLVAFFGASVGCGKDSLVSPTSSLPSASVQPTIKSAGDAITPTPLLSTFTFRRVADSSAPSASLGLWDLRGKNSEEVVRMGSFCGTGVTAGAQENPGVRPVQKPAAPFRLLVSSSEFSSYDVNVMREILPEIQNQLGVPLSIELGVATPFSGAPGVINVFRNPNFPKWWASNLVVEGGLIVSGDIFAGTGFGSAVHVMTRTGFRHELGHVVLGLCHHNAEGLMSGLYTEDGLFSKAELDNIEMMRRLAPGTTYPGASSSSSSKKYTLKFENCDRH